MRNVFVNTIVFVSDIEKSKHFYIDLLGMKTTRDFESIVFFENGLVLHVADSILKTVYKKSVSSAERRQGRNNLLIYFESDRLQNFYDEIKDEVEVLHEIEEQSWGQKVFRFLDPDSHIIEFGEPFHSSEFDK